MKTTMQREREIDPVSLRKAWLIKRAWRPTWESPISPSSSARGTSAATLSTKQLALNDVYGRLRNLVDQATSDGQHLALTHQGMAQRLGCSREMVSKLVKDLELGGYLRRVAAGEYQRLKTLPARW